MSIPPPAPGHNSSAFDIALERFDRSGYMLARFETLMKAIDDGRLNRSALRVLSALIQSMNRTTLTSWLGYDAIMDQSGLNSTKSVENYISQLGSLGYIVAERRQTPEAGNRMLRHYTLSALSPEEIEAAINRAVASLNGEIDTVVEANFSQPSGKPAPVSPTIVGGPPTPVGCPQPVSPSRVGENPEISQPSGKNTVLSQPSGSSTIPIITTVETPNSNSPPSEPEAVAKAPPEKRATRLPDDWRLPKGWGDWAMDNFYITRDQVVGEAQRFKDYWAGVPGAKATKKDWPATWRNWIRGSQERPKYRMRKVDTSIAPDLHASADAGDDMDAALERARQAASKR